MTVTKRKMGSLLAALGLIALAGTAGAPPALAQQAEVKSLLQVVRERGKLLAGVRYDYPPFGSIGKDGKPVGYGIDVAQAFADKLGVKLELVQITSKSRIPMIIDGKVDCEIGPTSMSADRDEVIDFSIPYAWDGVTIIVNKGMPMDVKAYAPPRVVSTTQGSINAELMREVVPNADFKLYQEYTDALVALLNKKVDGVVVTTTQAIAFIKKHPELARIPDFYWDAIGIGMRENDSDWRDFINFTLQEMWADGKLQKIWEKHFDSPPEWKMWSEHRLQPGIKPGQKRFGDRKEGKT